MTFRAPIEIEEIPPLAYLKIISEHCPKALCLYIKLWEERSAENKVVAYKDEVRFRFMTTLTRFKNDLMALFKEGLVSIDETPSALHIELVDWNEEEAC